LAQKAALKIGTANSRKKLEWFIDALSKLNLPKSIPKGICHCDFHFSNILFREGELVALIDFDDANYTYLTYDLATLINPFMPSFEWDTWSQFEQGENVFDFREGRKVIVEYEKVRRLKDIEKRHLFDVYKLCILFDCVWYFDRGEADDFYERRKIDELNRFGRENFYRELFSSKTSS